MLPLPLLQSVLNLVLRGKWQLEPGGMDSANGRKSALLRLVFYHRLHQAIELAARQSRKTP